MTLFTYAYCVKCAELTIGGKGHECKVRVRQSEFERAYFRWLRRHAIRARASR